MIHQIEMYKQTPAKRSKPNFAVQSLPPGLGCNDVICGRHRDACNNIGNRRFRILVAIQVHKYIHAPTRAHKSMVIRDLVDTIHSVGGRFVHQRKAKKGGVCAAAWETLEDKQTYDKVGHAFRDMLASVKVKSEMNNLLLPSQPTPSGTDSIQQQCIDPSRTKSDNDIVPPVLSFQVSQDTTVPEKEDMVDDLNRCHNIADYDDDNDDHCSTFNLSEEELEQCKLTSEAILPLTCSFDGNDVYNNNCDSFQYAFCTDIPHGWRRDSIQSFQCLAL